MGGGARTARPQPALACLGTWPGEADRSRTCRRFRRSLIRSLIHLCPQPFIGGHEDHVCAGPDGGEPSRTPTSIVGKRVGGNPSRVRISHPPPPLTRQYTSPGQAFGLGLPGCAVSLQPHFHSTYIGIKRPRAQAHSSECYRGRGRPLAVPALSEQLAHGGAAARGVTVTAGGSSSHRSRPAAAVAGLPPRRQARGRAARGGR
jgi:hypothetical protein